MIKRKINDVKRSPLGNCIVLHDFSNDSPDIKKWVDYSVSLFGSLGLTPNRIGISAPEITSKSTVTFNGGLKQLNRISLKTLQGIGIYANPAFDEKDNWETLCSINFNTSPSKKNTLVLVCDDQLFPFEKSLINKITRELSDFLKPNYGYAYQRLFKQGPMWYAYGTIVGLDWDDKEEDDITKWNHKYRINNYYKTGDLRDIYPMNVLSKAHQSLKIDSLPFFEWIKADSKRGSLTALNDSLWAWWVEPENIPSVRESLRPLGWMLAV